MKLARKEKRAAAKRAAEEKKKATADKRNAAHLADLQARHDALSQGQKKRSRVSPGQIVDVYLLIVRQKTKAAPSQSRQIQLVLWNDVCVRLTMP